VSKRGSQDLGDPSSYPFIQAMVDVFCDDLEKAVNYVMGL